MLGSTKNVTRTPPVARPAVSIAEIDDSASLAAEVVVLWGDTVLCASHLRANRTRPAAFTIGEDPACDCLLPASLGFGKRAPLVTAEPGGEFHVLVPAGASGDVTAADGRARWTFAEMKAQGRARPSADVAGAHAIALDAGARCQMTVGAFGFLVRVVPAAKALPKASFAFEWRENGVAGISLALHLGFLMILVLAPPSSRSLTTDLSENGLRMISTSLEGFEQPPVPPEPAATPDVNPAPAAAQGGPQGGAAAGDPGRAGRPDSPQTGHHLSVRGPADNPHPTIGQPTPQELATHAGILGIISHGFFAPTSPFHAEVTSGFDPDTHDGGATGPFAGDDFGNHGFVMHGPGVGGGGRIFGWVGAGPLPTIGPRGPGGDPSGIWRNGPELHTRGPAGHTPVLRVEQANVVGPLSREVIRRVIHRHLNEVSACYERELGTHPDLRGRVSIEFIIGADGAVQSSVVDHRGTNLGNTAAEQCIANAAQRWAFDAPPDHGVVVVTYPFFVEPAE